MTLSSVNDSRKYGPENSFEASNLSMYILNKQAIKRGKLTLHL